jgi:hypothetical protein
VMLVRCSLYWCSIVHIVLTRKPMDDAKTDGFAAVIDTCDMTANTKVNALTHLIRTIGTA